MIEISKTQIVIFACRAELISLRWNRIRKIDERRGKNLKTITSLVIFVISCLASTVNANLGVCCFQVNCESRCEFMTEDDCIFYPGSTYFPNDTCATVSCPPPSTILGACCYQDGDVGDICIEQISWKNCMEVNGSWYQGADCTCVPCNVDPPNEGACCYEDADLGWICIYTDFLKCDTYYFGIWYPGVPCNNVHCEPVIENGACCYYDECIWQCSFLDEDSCLSLPQSTFFAGTPCNQIQCPTATDEAYGACCYMDANNVLTCVYTHIEKCDNYYFGIWHPGVGCDCIDCEDDFGCQIVASPDCVGPPQYPYPDYQIFGNGQIAVETASPSILGGSLITVFDLSGVLPVDQDFQINRYSHPSWEHPNNDPAPDLGSIFGLAIDEVGNLYVTATRTWANDVMGTGGWGAVYKIDTNTAQISIFATIPMPNSQSSLGTITYDCDHGQFFVSSFEDGLIYRLEYGTGAILDSFDHGASYTGMPGPAALGDRPWAVEVHGERLYYSLWNADIYDPSTSPNEVWSVSLDITGAPIAGSEQHECTLPGINGAKLSSPVSDIDFSVDGVMFLAERSQTNIETVGAHNSRVLEFECTQTGWTLSPNIYSVGVFSGTNTAGGVDATLTRVWTSGDALHFSSGDNIYGFQGLPLGGGDISTSVLVDYQGDVTGTDKTLLGDIVCTDESSDPPEIGACCYLDDCNSSCAVMNQVACASYWGSTFYPNVNCAAITCPPMPQDVGACCYNTEMGTDCMELTELNCDDLLGVWYPGLSCVCVECDSGVPTGACCYLEIGSGYLICAELTESDCNELPLSSYNGDGSLCINTVCCEPIGACCISSNCIIIPASQCANSNGYYFGDGALCTNVDCASCPADFDDNGEVNVADLLYLIGSWGTCP